MNDFRSSVRAMARQISGLSKGGLSRLTIRLVFTFIGAISQIAAGSCALMSCSSGMVTSAGNVMSSLPATNARMAVEQFGMTVNSMPSRYGSPGFQ